MQDHTPVLIRTVGGGIAGLLIALLVIIALAELDVISVAGISDELASLEADESRSITARLLTLCPMLGAAVANLRRS